jgi:L-rhamnose mutarotase
MKNKFSVNQKNITIALMVFMLCVTFSKHGKTQEQTPTLYALVEYMKVKPENVEKYLELAKDFWKPLQQERIAQKEIIGWRLFQVRYKGSSDEYNFVTAAFFDDFKKLEKVYNIDVQKVHPGRNIDDTMVEIYKVRDLVKTNLLVVNSRTSSNVPYKFLQVNFMQVKQGEESAYVNMENTIWKPVHQELVNAGSRAGWSLWSTVYPGGSGNDYQFLAVDDLSEFKQIEINDLESIFGKVHAGKSVNELMNQTNNSRILVRSELWELLDSVSGQ